MAIFIALQFPFADLRGFLEGESGRIAFPYRIKRDFIRSSGNIKKRYKNGIKEWAGEELYCSSDLALRFPDHLGEKIFAPDSVKAIIVDTYRRFYSNSPVARFEVALLLKPKLNIDKIPPSEWIKLVQDVLCIPMHERNPPHQETKSKNTPKIIKLLHAQNTLAKHYLAATTNRQIEPHIKPEEWWYSPGTPALVIEADKECAFLKAFPYTKHVLDVPQAAASVFHAWIDFDNLQPCSTWFIAMGKGDPDAVRRLRINLTRLHAERECLNIVLHNIGTLKESNIKLSKNFDQLDTIRNYIKKSLASIQAAESFGMNRSSMFAAAHEAFGIEFEGFESTLQDLGWQLAENVKNYIRRAENKAKISITIHGGVMITNIQMGNVTVSGDFTFVTAKNITNSFNKIGESNANDDLKEKLKVLAIEVAKLAKELPPDKAEEVTRDLDSLTSEAVAKNPRKKWYELSLQGILDAAIFVASMIGPISTAVKDVSSLLP